MPFLDLWVWNGSYVAILWIPAHSSFIWTLKEPEYSFSNVPGSWKLIIWQRGYTWAHFFGPYIEIMCKLWLKKACYYHMTSWLFVGVHVWSINCVAPIHIFKNVVWYFEKNVVSFILYDKHQFFYHKKRIVMYWESFNFFLKHPSSLKGGLKRGRSLWAYAIKDCLHPGKWQKMT